MMHVTRRHTISAAHRLYEYNGQCERLHGHNYKIEITVSAENLNRLGMVLDFGLVKKILCGALDAAWDHRTLLYDRDPLCAEMQALLHDGAICPVPFNPTAENMATHLATVLFPAELARAGLTNVLVTAVTVYETDNNSATWSLDESAD
ncbi:MAG: 6-carboxytetrahydropterin synthase [Desulfovibrionaceae bacterium]|nr:6-carboxytetrahydropterin synthase [Desulfovibrionaceae bacterium]